MPNNKKFLSVILMSCLFILTQTSCVPMIGRAIKQISENAESGSQKGQSSPDWQKSQSSPGFKPHRTKKINVHGAFAEFQHEILNDLKREDFAAIDAKADKARREKERMTGGYWKLKTLYDAVTQLYEGEYESEEAWLAHLDKIKRWKEKSPDSITARIALAESYTGYGWFARGTGFSNTVESADWKKLHERLDLSYNELIEARKLGTPCPEWYEAMLYLGMAQDWNEEDYEALLDEAIAFEPNYYYYYYSKAENSSPRWGGNKGDAEKFAERIKQLKTDEKDIIFYLYESLLVNSYYKELTQTQSRDWETAKKGYKELETRFGTDNRRLNQYSLIASVNEDMPEAYQAFKKIGDAMDEEVYSPQRFNEIRSWAIARYEAENPSK